MEETIRAALMKWKPAKVCVFFGDELHRTITVGKALKSGRHRWAAVIDVIEPMPWTTIELRGGKDELLNVLIAERDAEPREGGGDSTDRDERILRLLIQAQKEALGYREREASAALNACVQVMRQMTDAVGTLSNLHELQLRSLQRAAADLPDGEEGQLQSMNLLKMVAPQLLAKFLGTEPPKIVSGPPPNAKPQPPKPPNGA